jgi:hypothetical protein
VDLGTLLGFFAATKDLSPASLADGPTPTARQARATD